jgi:hypothetical protein
MLRPPAAFGPSFQATRAGVAGRPSVRTTIGGLD